MAKITSTTRNDNYELIVQSASGHELIIDEPEELGGKNKGMSPDELIIAALAGCTSATLKMYAQRKNWDLQEVKTEIYTEKNETPGGLPIIHRSIELVGNLDEEQRERILVIANKCPVHKMLSGEMTIETTME